MRDRPPIPWWQHLNTALGVVIAFGLILGVIRVSLAWPY